MGYRIFGVELIGYGLFRSDGTGCRVGKSLIFAFLIYGMRDIFAKK